MTTNTIVNASYKSDYDENFQKKSLDEQEIKTVPLEVQRLVTSIGPGEEKWHRVHFAPGGHPPGQINLNSVRLPWDDNYQYRMMRLCLHHPFAFLTVLWKNAIPTSSLATKTCPLCKATLTITYWKKKGEKWIPVGNVSPIRSAAMRI